PLRVPDDLRLARQLRPGLLGPVLPELFHGYGRGRDLLAGLQVRVRPLDLRVRPVPAGVGTAAVRDREAPGRGRDLHAGLPLPEPGYGRDGARHLTLRAGPAQGHGRP